MRIRIIYQTHKWLAVAALVASLAWFVSGTLMAVPGRLRTSSPNMVVGAEAEATLTNAPGFADARVSVASAIAAVRARSDAPGRITSVRMRRFPGRLAYQIAGSDGTHLIDATTGVIFAVDAAMAEQIARQAVGPDTALGPVTVQRTPTSDYRGPFPVYRVPAADGKGTVFYVSGISGDARFSDRRSRMFTSIVNWHDFFFLTGLLSDSAVRAALFVFAVLGTAMTLAGVLILVMQFQTWQRRRFDRSPLRPRRS
jgi:hypothetical protein